MRSVTVTAHAAQGLTCFHQYLDPRLKTLSIDMLYTTLDAFKTTTTLACAANRQSRPGAMSAVGDLARAYQYLSRITNEDLTIETHNDFDPDIGLASSSSGYACIAAAATRLLGLSEETADVSRLARAGSFSAAASVSAGISIVRRREPGVPSFGEQVFGPEDLPELSVVVAFSRYEKANHDFYAEAASSPVVSPIRDAVAETAELMIRALQTRDIDRLAEMSERHSVLNYAVLHTGENNLFLWQPETVAVTNFVRSLRRTQGEPVFYSMNTGANMFVYCFSESARAKVEAGLRDLSVDSRVSKIGGPVRYAGEGQFTGMLPRAPGHPSDRVEHASA